MSTQLPPPPPGAPYGTPPAGPNPYATNPYAPAPAPLPGQQVYSYPAPAAYPGGYPGGTPSCRFCGGVPAVDATFKRHQGFLVVMRSASLNGPFCRTCGIAAHRDMTAKSLWQGWWGFASLLINPLTMLGNLGQRSKVNKLPEPVPGAPGVPMRTGRPLFARIAAVGFLVPVLVVAGVVYAAQQDPSYASVGDCVHSKSPVVPGVTDTDPDVVVISCSDPSADAKIVGKVSGTTDSDTACKKFSDADGFYSQEQGGDKYILCLQFLH